nr:MAG TPA: hypothetical protein [Caudoviricetes sp.]
MKDRDTRYISGARFVNYLPRDFLRCLITPVFDRIQHIE